MVWLKVLHVWENIQIFWEEKEMYKQKFQFKEVRLHSYILVLLYGYVHMKNNMLNLYEWLMKDLFMIFFTIGFWDIAEIWLVYGLMEWTGIVQNFIVQAT